MISFSNFFGWFKNALAHKSTFQYNRICKISAKRAYTAKLIGGESFSILRMVFEVFPVSFLYKVNNKKTRVYPLYHHSSVCVFNNKLERI